MSVRSVVSQWKKDRSDQSELTDLTDQQRWELYSRWLDHDQPAVRANAVICLIHQANYLLDQQIDALEQQFIDEGGYSEQLATARLRKRAQSQASRKANDAAEAHAGPDESPRPAPPPCPVCGGLTTLRTAKSGRHPVSQFWGCTNYPQCEGTTPV
jgi:four helix bundle suffix protein